MIAGLGVSPIGWSNDDMRELGGDISLERCLEDTSRAGYAGIELGHKFPREANALRAILESYNLRLLSGWYSGELLEREVEEEKDEIASTLALFKSLECPVLVYGEGARSVQSVRERPLASRPVLDDEQMKAYARKLDALARHCRDAGVPLVFHHHKGTAIETEQEVDALMATTDKDLVHLLFDTGHMLFAGSDPLPVLQRHARRVRHFHAKDLRAEILSQIEEGEDSFLDCVLQGVFTVPGDGVIDYAPLLQVLAECDYEGWLVVEAEQDPTKADPYKYACKGFEHLRSLAAQQGMTTAIDGNRAGYGQGENEKA